MNLYPPLKNMFLKRQGFVAFLWSRCPATPWVMGTAARAVTAMTSIFSVDLRRTAVLS